MNSGAGSSTFKGQLEEISGWGEGSEAEHSVPDTHRR